MTQVDRGRHCAVCDRVVVDVCALPRAQAQSFLDDAAARLTRGERICARVLRDRHGRIRSPGPRRHVLTNGLASLLALAAFGQAPAADQTPPTPPRDAAPLHPPVAGGLCPPAPHVSDPVSGLTFSADWNGRQVMASDPGTMKTGSTCWTWRLPDNGDKGAPGVRQFALVARPGSPQRTVLRVDHGNELHTDLDPLTGVVVPPPTP